MIDAQLYNYGMSDTLISFYKQQVYKHASLGFPEKLSTSLSTPSGSDWLEATKNFFNVCYISKKILKSHQNLTSNTPIEKKFLVIYAICLKTFFFIQGLKM